MAGALREPVQHLQVHSCTIVFPRGVNSLSCRLVSRVLHSPQDELPGWVGGRSCCLYYELRRVKKRVSLWLKLTAPATCRTVPCLVRARSPAAIAGTG